MRYLKKFVVVIIIITVAWRAEPFCAAHRGDRTCLQRASQDSGFLNVLETAQMTDMPSVRNSLWWGKQRRVFDLKCPIYYDPEHIYKKACRNLNSIKFLSAYITSIYLTMLSSITS